MAVDTKMTGTIGEHYVCAMLARHGWAPALTRDGLARTDILAAQTTGERRAIEVQVKSIRSAAKNPDWPLGTNSQGVALNDREWFVFVLIDPSPAGNMRTFVVPRDHVAATIWIEHQHWLTEPGVRAGKRNTPLSNARSSLAAFVGYEDRWDLLLESAHDAPVLLPPVLRKYAMEERVGLPAGHPWIGSLPVW
ncbi:hypothetical protein H9657_12850 [Cellulomonas sp. Sa3CUA2]|uniref:DUF4365 domain-containing protein n=1 Tax=Cellulomonas avistercoris TaxID=2762242 RepID=A0ABR8QFF3_9CELL|nr:hypothetical protein [Cellulomonas avistercoris]MBD7919160.1 hypothetical protein [Cellulomonas avistercoris]